jgi:uncharacterized protein YkwD
MKAVLLAVTAAVVLAALAFTAPALGDGSRWDAYLAPASACPGSELTNAPVDVQQRALVCLVNWTRRVDGLRALQWSGALAHAAGRKANAITACRSFSHEPCGRLSGPGQRFGVWGENLYWGTQALASPRAAMRAWLESPEHRTVLLARPWRSLGIRLLPGSVLEGQSGVALWVLEVAGQESAHRR